MRKRVPAYRDLRCGSEGVVKCRLCHFLCHRMRSPTCGSFHNSPASTTFHNLHAINCRVDCVLTKREPPPPKADGENDRLTNQSPNSRRVAPQLDAPQTTSTRKVSTWRTSGHRIRTSEMASTAPELRIRRIWLDKKLVPHRSLRRFTWQFSPSRVPCSSVFTIL